jgi:hypothetical protein
MERGSRRLPVILMRPKTDVRSRTDATEPRAAAPGPARRHAVPPARRARTPVP